MNKPSPVLQLPVVRENRDYGLRFALEVDRDELFSQIVILEHGNGIILARMGTEDLERDWPISNRPGATPENCAKVWLKSTQGKSNQVTSILERIIMATSFPDMTTEQLVEFYNKHSGKDPIKKFENRAIAEKRCSDLLAGLAKPETETGDSTKENEVSTAAQTAANGKTKKVKTVKTKTVKAKKQSEGGAVGKPRENNKYVATSKEHHMHEGSTRKQVYDAIKSAGANGVYRDTIEKKLNIDNVSGYIAKLMEMGYVKQG